MPRARCSAAFGIPLKGSLESRSHSNSWSVSQVLTGGRDIGERMPDIPRARLLVNRLDLLSGQLAQLVEQRVQRYTLATSDIESHTCHAFCFSCKEIGVNRVVDIAEVPRLLAVAVHNRSPALKEGEDEPGDDGGVMRKRVLPWAEDVEVAKRHRFEAVDLMKRAAVALGGQLCHRVGTDRQRRHVLALRQLGVRAVGRRRRREDDPPHPLVACGEQDVQGADHVRGITGQRVLDRAGYRGESGLMEDEVATANRVVHALVALDVTFDELDVVEQPGEVFAVASGEVVKDAHTVAIRKQARDQARPDEAGTAGYERLLSQFHRREPSESRSSPDSAWRSSALIAGRMAPQHLCTHFDRRYLARGLVLYRSLRRVGTEFTLHVFCLDEATKRALDTLSLPGVVTYSLTDLERDNPQLLAVRETRTRVEYYWTLTPMTCLHVLNSQPEVNLLVRVDADLSFYADPSPVLEELGDGSVLLTAHRLSPEFFDSPDEPALWGGTYNVQFEAFRRTPTAIAALEWWRDRCLEWCYDRFEPGRYGDQKYLEKLPELFDGVVTASNPGAGLAPWNVASHRIETNNGDVSIDGSPLIFHHFQSLEIHPSTGIGLNLARGGRSYRVSDEAAPLVWTTGWRLREPELDALWEPYVRELSRAHADLRLIDAVAFEPPPLKLRRAVFHLIRRRTPIVARDALQRLRAAYWARRRVKRA